MDSCLKASGVGLCGIGPEPIFCLCQALKALPGAVRPRGSGICLPSCSDRNALGPPICGQCLCSISPISLVHAAGYRGDSQGMRPF